MSDDLLALLAFAEKLADAGGAVARRYFRTRVAVDDKPDDSPVTIADREAETAMRALIAKTYPEHGVIGEEHGVERVGASHVWVLDPIDGTKSFITGRPMFGVLVALCRDGRPVAGVIDCPAMFERWTGAAGQPSRHTVRGETGVIRTRPCAQLSQAALYCTTPHMFTGPDAEGFERVRSAVKLPLYGGDCYAYGLMASGYADLVIEADLKSYDWAALEPVIAGAGGSLTDWQGRPLDLAASSVRVLAAGDPTLRDAAIARLAG